VSGPRTAGSTHKLVAASVTNAIAQSFEACELVLSLKQVKQTMHNSAGMRSVARAGMASAMSLAVAACSSSVIGPPDNATFQIQSTAGVLFMTQNVVQDFVMDALFQGPVIVDDDGCLRLEDPERPTVVWPWGFTAQITDAEISIRDQEGTEVGQVGESFALGGGIVPELLDSLGFSQEDRDLATNACPGSYWIVA